MDEELLEWKKQGDRQVEEGVALLRDDPPLDPTSSTKNGAQPPFTKLPAGASLKL